MESILDSKLYKAIAEASDRVYIYAMDLKRGSARWSKSSVHYFDLPGEYMDDPTTIWGSKIHPDDREAYFADIESVFSGKTSHHSCQYRALNRYGEYVWLECTGTMVCDEAGNKDVFAGIMIRLDVQNIYDPITGLPTKTLLYEYQYTEESGVALLLGVDNYKQLNNIYGFNYVDEILIALAKRFSKCCEENHRLIHFNDDEFLIFLPEAGKDKALHIFETIMELTKKIVMKDGRQIDISISGGAITYSQENRDTDQMINQLHLALTYIREVNKGSLAFYSYQIEQRQNRISMIKKDLKNSIANNFCGFELYYQPWVDAHGSRILGCEALLRWEGEHIKDAGPQEFIPLLEEDISIIEVGHWVMKEAMKQQKEWQMKYGDFKVSFNVSYQQFLEVDYVDELIKTAKQYGVKPENMVIELTESCNVVTPQNLEVVFKKIREHHFHIALDDFGTGYASLSMLKNLPVDEIKIDHSFVRELTKEGHEVDFAVIESIMLLCDRLNCKVVVEGVENKEVDTIIRDMNATYLQGYYYSKPICKDDFEHMLNDNLISGITKQPITIINEETSVTENETHSYTQLAMMALSSTYISMHLLNVKEDTFSEYRAIPSVHNLTGISGRITGTLEKIMVSLITDEYIENTLEFVRIDTLDERLRDKQSITHKALGKISGWCRFTFIPVTYDAQGKLEHVLFTVDKIDK